MLGSTAEAEEVVQDAWLRWHEADRVAIANTEAWLVTIATRLSIDRLRAARVQLMREAFDCDCDELAQVLGKSEAACRQMVSRAKAQLRDPRPRYEVAPEAHLRAMRRFADALAQGSFDAVKAMLAEDAELIADGGGRVPSFGVPLQGAPRIAQLYLAVHLRFGAGVRDGRRAHRAHPRAAQPRQAGAHRGRVPGGLSGPGGGLSQRDRLARLQGMCIHHPDRKRVAP
jgi:RNA polymerase sigma-70 factor (ECF subfamily)